MMTVHIWPPLLGGALIGLGAVILMAALGRIMGISGLLGGLLTAPTGADSSWRWAFFLGMAVPAVAVAVLGGGFPSSGSGQGVMVLIAAGFLVGFGTRMGNGCTSGHGICGLARLSVRSLAAVCTFMAVAALVVFIRRHVIGG